MTWQEVIPGKVALKINKPLKTFHYFSLGEITGGDLFPFTQNTTWKVEMNIVAHPSERIGSDYQEFSTFYWGMAGDIPVSNDYDGDGTMDVAVYRRSAGQWFIRTSGNPPGLVSPTAPGSIAPRCWGPRGGRIPSPTSSATVVRRPAGC